MNQGYVKNVSFQVEHEYLTRISSGRDQIVKFGEGTSEFSATFVGVSSLEDAVRVLVKSLGWTLKEEFGPKA